jgi:hypothetical protein
VVVFSCSHVANQEQRQASKMICTQIIFNYLASDVYYTSIVACLDSFRNQLYK